MIAKVQCRPVDGKVEIVFPITACEERSATRERDMEFVATIVPADAENLARAILLVAKSARGEGLTQAEIATVRQ